MRWIPLIIASDELRYWKRSKLAMNLFGLFFILALTALVISVLSAQSASHQREHLQQKSEQTFVDQPDRHPHRMVHYGHYLFRSPTPLSNIDPGVDAYTGTAIFLEGHRQNSATFSDRQQSSGLKRFGLFTPAFVLQVLTPLLLILSGYSVLSREREARTLDFLLVQGVSQWQLIVGKGIALLLVCGLMLTPLLLGCLLAIFAGESGLVSMSFLASYGLYLLIWCVIVLLVSASAKSNSSAFTQLICVWIALCVLLPRIASTTATAAVVSPGKIETDFDVLAEKRKMADGHNASDPKFDQLKTQLLETYQVDSVEELPVNFRGVVARASEQDLTKLLNRFAEKRMQQEQQQSSVAHSFGWLSPVVAMRTVSMQLAGTDLLTHHRFLREAEAVRFQFVDDLNRTHAEQLDYQDDVNRYQSDDHLEKARISAANWQRLQQFNFTPASAETRFAQSRWGLVQLFAWLGFLMMGFVYLARRR